MARRILISAGEASGEAYGAQLMEALRELDPALECFGLGGERMRAAGFDAVIDAKDVAVVGITEVVKHLPPIYRQFRRLLAEVDKRKPAAAVLIDFPDFNLRLARELHKRGIPVVYFVSPQLWAWRKSRLSLVRKYVKKMLVIFPFEEEFYRKHGVQVEYVGHPLAESAAATPSRAEFATHYQLDATKQWIALLPGSRRKELQMNLPEMLKAAAQMGNAYEFILPVASTLSPSWVLEQIGSSQVRLVEDAGSALALAKASVVASGTATVEAALAGNPFVVVYRVSPLTYAIGRRLVKLEHYAMVNLIAGREIVPELIQKRFTAQNIVGHVRSLLAEGPERQRMMEDLREIRRRLAPSGGINAAERAAAAVLASIQN